MSRAHRHWLRAGAALAVSVLIMAGCGGNEEAGEPSATDGGTEPEVVTIGAILPLTGPFSYFGQIFRDALTLRFEQQGYEVAGKRIELQIVDDGNELETAQARARELVERDGAAMILGPFNSALMSGLAPYWEEHQVPVFAVQSTPVEVALSEWIFNPQGTLAQISYPIGRYAAEEMGIETATFLAPDYIAGWRIGAGFAQGFMEGGGDVAQTQWPPLTETDFSSYVSNLDPADAVVSWFPATQAAFLQQLHSVDADTPKVLAYGNGLSDTQMEGLPPDVLEGVTTSIQYVWGLDTPASEQFTQDYLDTYDRYPDVQNDLAVYEEASMMIEALEATDGDTDPGRLRDALLNLDYSGPAGDVRFDENGIGIRDFLIVQTTEVDGRMTWEVVHTYPEVPTILEPLDHEDL